MMVVDSISEREKRSESCSSSIFLSQVCDGRRQAVRGKTKWCAIVAALLTYILELDPV